MGKRKDLKDFDKDQIVMAGWVGRASPKQQALVGCSLFAVVSTHHTWFPKAGSWESRANGSPECASHRPRLATCRPLKDFLPISWCPVPEDMTCYRQVVMVWLIDGCWSSWEKVQSLTNTKAVSTLGGWVLPVWGLQGESLLSSSGFCMRWDTSPSFQVCQYGTLPCSVSLGSGWCSEHLYYRHLLFGIYILATCCFTMRTESQLRSVGIPSEKHHQT